MRFKGIPVFLSLLAVILILAAGCTTPTPPTTPTPTPTATMTMTMTVTPSAVPTTKTTAPATTTIPSGGSVNVGLIAKNLAFNTSMITVPACSAVTVTFDNQDSSIPHNLAVYTNSQATTPVFKGDIITGKKTISYTFMAPCTPGDYFFRCDVHPMMSGTFRVV